MAIKKFNRKQFESKFDEEGYSKTQQKNESLAIKKFGLELIELSAQKLANLPISDVTLKSLIDYQKMKTNLAKKRHIMFIGKCLRNEDKQSIRDFLDSSSAENLKDKNTKKTQTDPDDEILEQLIEQGDSFIDKLLLENSNLQRQSLRQILRNIKSAITAEKKQVAMNKMKSYLKDSIKE